MTPEGKVVAHLVARCKQLGLEQRKLGYEGRRGAPDRMVIAPHAIGFFEVKRPGGRPSPEQIREIQRLAGVPCVVAMVVDSTDAVDAALDTLTALSDTWKEERR